MLRIRDIGLSEVMQLNKDLYSYMYNKKLFVYYPDKRMAILMNKSELPPKYVSYWENNINK